jgi:hypothetical protein
MNEQPKNLQVVAPRDYHDIITKVASVKDVDVDKLERLMKIQEEWEKRQAATHFNEQMALAQGAMTQISKDSANPLTRSTYASLEALDQAIRPIYTQHGFSVAFNDETPDERRDGWLRLIAYVSNGAETRPYTKWIPWGTTGIRGQTAMTATHASIGAVTYGRRALLKMIFNLAEEEDDGNMAGGRKRAKTEMEGSPEGAQGDQQTTPLDADGLITGMRACRGHSELYLYKETTVAPRWKNLVLADRERLEKEYNDLMTKFAEA